MDWLAVWVDVWDWRGLWIGVAHDFLDIHGADDLAGDGIDEVGVIDFAPVSDVDCGVGAADTEEIVDCAILGFVLDGTGELAKGVAAAHEVFGAVGVFEWDVNAIRPVQGRVKGDPLVMVGIEGAGMGHIA